ncbi:unnamed protein product, partial [Urochloa humidicola]
PEPLTVASYHQRVGDKLRRERISETMKLLQDLVPGCSKVILGKQYWFFEAFLMLQTN